MSPRVDTRELAASARYALQDDLVAIFEKYDLDVSVGVTRKGVAVRSQDARVDVKNLGEVVAR